MAISKKASLLLVLLVGIVGVIMKFLLNPFGGVGSQVDVKRDEVVVEDIPTSAPIQAPQTTQTPPTPAPTQTTEPATVPTPAPVTAKKISVNTSYGSPAGDEKVGFVLTVDASGIITGAETVVKATDDKSTKYQNAFKAELPSQVVGKKLSDLKSIDRVGKASLTTNAFNTSLSQLKSQI